MGRDFVNGGRSGRRARGPRRAFALSVASAGSALLVWTSACSTSSGDVSSDASTEGAAGDAVAQGDGASTDAAVACVVVDDADTGRPNAFDDAAIVPPVSVIRLNNELCMPGPLNEDSNGKVPCRIVVALPSCSGPGLSSADQATLDEVHAQIADAGGSTPSGALCVLAEQTASSSCQGTCSDEGTPGWCYVHSACTEGASPCKQALCTTRASGIDFVGAWLLCP